MKTSNYDKTNGLRFVYGPDAGKIISDPRYGDVREVVGPPTGPLERVAFAEVFMPRGAVSPPHFHVTTEELYRVLAGRATVFIQDESREIGPGDTVVVPRGLVHSIQAQTDLKFLCVTAPPYTPLDDIETSEFGSSESRLKICIVAGSTRREGVSRRVARAVAQICRDLAVSVEVVDLAEMPVDAMAHKELGDPPDSITGFARPALEADGLIIITPEYNGGIPGPLKVFIDLMDTSRFANKPVTFVGVAAGSWGALRPVEHLQAIFINRNAFVFPQSTFVRDSDEAITPDVGVFATDELRLRVQDQCRGFLAFCASLVGLKSPETTEVRPADRA